MATATDPAARTAPPKNRLIGPMPRIGIRPAIDGRRKGVRESLETQTLEMARSVAELLQSKLRHSNGLPVECVIPSTCIGGVAESAQTAALFEGEAVGLTLTVTPAWCYGAETMDMNPLYPKAVWGFNGTERPGAVYLAAVLAAHNQKGLPAFGIYGRDVQDSGDTTIPPDVEEKLLRFARAGIAVATMRGKSYLSLDPEEYARAAAWVKAHCKEGRDYNKPGDERSRAQKDADWETSIKMAMIARDLMIGNPRLAEADLAEEALGRNAILGGFQGQRHWTDHYPNGDFMEAILNSSFDWNGVREAFVFATENDCLNGVGMLFGHLLTSTAQIFADVRTYWSPEAVKRVTDHDLRNRAAGGIIHLINSGAATLDASGRMTASGAPVMKPFWEITPEDVRGCLEATTWYPAVTEYFRGGGYSSGFLTVGEMPMTMSRVNLVAGLGPVLQIAEGWTVDLPERVYETLNERTNPTWPTHWFVPRTEASGPFRDVYSVMNGWGANHGSISYGHIGADLITLASMLRIPVFMHNVPEEDVFRPSAWTSFGAHDLQGGDFRACANFGPLYGR
jgi:L-fucose isomerase